MLFYYQSEKFDVKVNLKSPGTEHGWFKKRKKKERQLLHFLKSTEVQKREKVNLKMITFSGT